jgi:hypothetical protein
VRLDHDVEHADVVVIDGCLDCFGGKKEGGGDGKGEQDSGAHGDWQILSVPHGCGMVAAGEPPLAPGHFFEE